MSASRSLSPSFSRSASPASVSVRPGAFGAPGPALGSVLGGQATGTPEETKVLDPITSIITGIGTQPPHTGPPTTVTPRSTSAPGAAPPKTPTGDTPQSPASTAPPGSATRGTLSTSGPGAPPDTSVGSLGHASASSPGSPSLLPPPSNGPTVTAMTTATTTERIATPAPLNLALIIGVIVGALLLLAGIGAVLFWLHSRHRRQEREQATASTPYPALAASNSGYRDVTTRKTAGFGVQLEDAPDHGRPESASTQELLQSSSSTSSNKKASPSRSSQLTPPTAPTTHIHSSGLRPLPTPGPVRAPGRGSFERLPPYSR